MAHWIVADHLETTGLDVNVMSTDDLSTIDNFSRLIDLEIERGKYVADFFANERVVLTELDELLVLGAEIVVSHASEFENVEDGVKKRLVDLRTRLLKYRMTVFNHYKEIVFGPSHSSST